MIRRYGDTTKFGKNRGDNTKKRARDKSDNALNAGKEQVTQRHIECLKETLKEVSNWYKTVEDKKI